MEEREREGHRQTHANAYRRRVALGGSQGQREIESSGGDGASSCVRQGGGGGDARVRALRKEKSAAVGASEGRCGSVASRAGKRERACARGPLWMGRRRTNHMGPGAS